MILDIILIGPYGVGKSTIARLLAEHLKLPQRSLDEFAYKFYEEVLSFAAEKETLGGLDDPRRQHYSAHAVKRFLCTSEFTPCVMDFGPQHSVYDGELFNEIQQALLLYTVVLLVPSPDREESIRLLAERNNRNVMKTPDHRTFNPYFIRHPSNYALANHVVYTKDKTPEETRDEILALRRA